MPWKPPCFIIFYYPFSHLYHKEKKSLLPIQRKQTTNKQKHQQQQQQQKITATSIFFLNTCPAKSPFIYRRYKEAKHIWQLRIASIFLYGARFISSEYEQYWKHTRLLPRRSKQRTPVVSTIATSRINQVQTVANRREKINLGSRNLKGLHRQGYLSERWTGKGK